MHLNDIHGKLNPTRVARLARPRGADEIAELVGASAAPVSIAGGYHAMGGQQLGEDTLHLDMRAMDRVLSLDVDRGLVRAESGIQWPALIGAIRARDAAGRWGIRQKQTGASDLTLGGSASANIHGRGLQLAPFVEDIESLRLVAPDGRLVECSRERNAELFSLVVGGYGLFGVIADITLRLAHRRTVMRCVDLATTDEIVDRFNDEIALGTPYGDFQFAIDHESSDFLQTGIFSRYRLIDDRPIPEGQIYFTPERWLELLRLARTRRTEAYHRYVDFYSRTSGQIYHSDTHQLSTYVTRYHDRLADLPPEAQGTEIISELYVERHRLADFMRHAAEILREHQAPLTYGTVRLIEPESTTYLPWATRPYACVIFNLLTPGTPAGIDRTAGAFRALIDAALARSGSFYLTYHRFASPAQVRQAYPQMGMFLALKRAWDPLERFRSAWYEHMAATQAVERAPARAFAIR